MGSKWPKTGEEKTPALFAGGGRVANTVSGSLLPLAPRAWGQLRVWEDEQDEGGWGKVVDQVSAAIRDCLTLPPLAKSLGFFYL